MPATARIAGLDLARGLAVLGMVVAHTLLLTVEYEGTEDTGWGWVISLSDGRPAVLFALLAGVSLGILTGRPVPYAGEKAVRARLRVLVRAAALLVFAAVLAMLDTGVAIILGYYAAWFMLALPFARLSARTVFGAAAAVLVLGPLVIWLSLLVPDLWFLAIEEGTPNDFLTVALIGGVYPGLASMAVVLTGLGLSRLDLAARRVQVWMLGLGAAVSAFAYGVSALVQNAYPVIDTDYLTDEEWEAGLGAPGPEWLATATPHSGSGMEMLAAGALAVAVLGACLLAPAALRKILAPLAATGAMTLTAYCGHIVVLALFPELMGGTGAGPVLVLVLGIMAFSWVWRRYVGRGPLERLLHEVSVRATVPPPPVAWARD